MHVILYQTKCYLYVVFKPVSRGHIYIIKCRNDFVYLVKLIGIAYFIKKNRGKNMPKTCHMHREFIF